MSNLKTVYEKTWTYKILRDEMSEEYFLNVVCGSVGIYLTTIKLEKEEIILFKSNENGLDDLAEAVCYNPKNFSDRTVKLK